jgi:hypothetical protein
MMLMLYLVEFLQELTRGVLETAEEYIQDLNKELDEKNQIKSPGLSYEDVRLYTSPTSPAYGENIESLTLEELRDHMVKKNLSSYRVRLLFNFNFGGKSAPRDTYIERYLVPNLSKHISRDVLDALSSSTIVERTKGGLAFDTNVDSAEVNLPTNREDFRQLKKDLINAVRHPIDYEARTKLCYRISKLVTDNFYIGRTKDKTGVELAKDTVDKLSQIINRQPNLNTDTLSTIQDYLDRMNKHLDDLTRRAMTSEELEKEAQENYEKSRKFVPDHSRGYKEITVNGKKTYTKVDNRDLDKMYLNDPRNTNNAKNIKTLNFYIDKYMRDSKKDSE